MKEQLCNKIGSFYAEYRDLILEKQKKVIIHLGNANSLIGELNSLEDENDLGTPLEDT